MNSRAAHPESARIQRNAVLIHVCFLAVKAAVTSGLQLLMGAYINTARILRRYSTSLDWLIIDDFSVRRKSPVLSYCIKIMLMVRNGGRRNQTKMALCLQVLFAGKM
jgi:hypothetical protein